MNSRNIEGEIGEVVNWVYVVVSMKICIVLADVRRRKQVIESKRADYVTMVTQVCADPPSWSNNYCSYLRGVAANQIDRAVAYLNE